MDRMKPREALTSRGNLVALGTWFSVLLLDVIAQLLERALA